MKIAVIGTGYVGLTTGTCFAEMGNEVLCMDIDVNKIERLKNGEIPIYEPGLEEMVKSNYQDGRLKFTTNSKEAIEFAEIVFSAVGTPEDENHQADLKYVKEVAKEFGKHLNEYKVFVNKSTVPVGTGDLCSQIIKEELEKRGEHIEFDAVSNPEFLREGTAITDTFNPDRIVIGHTSERSKKVMSRLYRTLTIRETPIVFTDLKTAEIIKYAANSLLATKISFINEIANFCELAGGKVKTVAKAIGLDKRIGEKFLNAGIGYGGSCFPKDVKALVETGKQHGYDFKIIKAVDEVNEKQKEVLFHKLEKLFDTLEGKTIAIWGLSFKPGTDDMREAPSITIINKLLQSKAKIQAYDPIAEESAKRIFQDSNINYSQSPFGAVQDADALLILTEWKKFRSIDLNQVKENMKKPLILDGRNIFEKEEMAELGIEYICIGQKNDYSTSRDHQELETQKEHQTSQKERESI